MARKTGTYYDRKCEERKDYQRKYLAEAMKDPEAYEARRIYNRWWHRRNRGSYSPHLPVATIEDNTSQSTPAPVIKDVVMNVTLVW